MLRNCVAEENARRVLERVHLSISGRIMDLVGHLDLVEYLDLDLVEHLDFSRLE